MPDDCSDYLAWQIVKIWNGGARRDEVVDMAGCSIGSLFDRTAQARGKGRPFFPDAYDMLRVRQGENSRKPRGGQAPDIY